MATITKRRVLVNPGRKRRKKLSPLQKLFFGSKRQRAAMKARKRNPSRRRTKKAIKKSLLRHFLPSNASKSTRRSTKRQLRKSPYHKVRVKKRVGNIGEILTIMPAAGNPSRKRTRKGVSTMARKRRRNRGVRVHRRRRRNPSVKTVVRYVRRRRRHSGGRRRRHNPGVVVRRRRHVKRYSRRRNPGIFSGSFGKVFGIVGGATVTKLIADRLPSGLTSGIVGYLTTGVVAFLQGKVVGKVFKNSSLGNDMVIGGFTYLAIKAVSEFVPGLSLPFGLRGMGLLSPSSFYVPQVNAPGSMGSFVRPSAVPAPYVPPANAMHGLGRTRRVGRVS